MGKQFMMFSKTDRWTKQVTSSEAYTTDGGRTWRWVSNNSFIMLDICREYGIPCDTVAQKAARNAEIDAFLTEYRAQQADEVNDEQYAEMQAAFGSGEVVVNVITGRRTQL